MPNLKINVLILGAGGIGNSGSGSEAFPAFMTEVKGAPLIKHLVESCNALSPSWIGIACSGSDIADFRIAELPGLLHPKAEYVTIKGNTKGAACTALLAAEKIDNEDELLILGVNEYIETEFKPVVEHFRQRQLDGGVLTFNSIHPRYSYVKTDTNDMVLQSAEKRPISNTAAATFFWYRRGSDFVSAAKDVIRKHDHVNDLYYIAPTINQLLLKQRRFGIEMIPSNRYHPLKTTRQLENFETAQEIRR